MTPPKPAPLDWAAFASAGGKARAKKLTKSARVAIARKAANTRWSKKKAPLKKTA